jgi:hypothetical protein
MAFNWYANKNVKSTGTPGFIPQPTSTAPKSSYGNSVVTTAKPGIVTVGTTPKSTTPLTVTQPSNANASLAVSSSPVPGGTNYNPQQTAPATVLQPAQGASQIQPAAGASYIQPAASGQTIERPSTLTGVSSYPLSQPTQTQIQAGISLPSPTSPTQIQNKAVSSLNQTPSSLITPSGTGSTPSLLSGISAPGSTGSGAGTGNVSAPGGGGGSTGITTGEEDKDKQKSAWQMYLESLKPTEEESNLQKQIDALNKQATDLGASEQMGLTNIEGKPIPMPFITGQKAQIQRQSASALTGLAAQQKPLLDRLAQLQADRTNQGKVFEATMGMQKPFEVSPGGTAMQFNPNTGKYEAVYSAPFAPKTDTSQSLDRFLTAAELASYGLPAGSTFADAVLKGSIPKENLTGTERINIAERIANQFDGEQLVKDFNQVVAARNMTQQIANDSKNPADNQALIYAFAKVMDPNSVVREGEYNTVQKYSQSWLERFGFNAMRVFNNQEFLTPEAVGMIKDAIEKKYNGNLYAYQNLSNEYGRRIDRITGGTDGTDYIANYALGSMTQPQADVISGGGTNANVNTNEPTDPVWGWRQ